MSNVLIEYFDALERLKKNVPNIVSKDTKITNDSVALEAGRGKGSIKKSRPVFSDLIHKIREAAEKQVSQKESVIERIGKEKLIAENYRRLYEEALARELSLIHEVYELKRKLAQLVIGKVKTVK